jgi:prepilin-type N-terminal cleavage/methylation domain-containing protein
MPDKKKGFTLIELLIVIGIIGVLASIVLVSMGSARAKARDAVRQADMRQWVSAMELYYNDYDKYFQKATMPADGEITYLPRVPVTPKTPAYGWVDNSAAANDQKFCIYATMETGCTVSGQLRYYTASHKGTVEVACTGTAPTWTAACP